MCLHCVIPNRRSCECWGRLVFLLVPADPTNCVFIDERCVPPDHPESNYRMAEEALLSKVPGSVVAFIVLMGSLGLFV